MAPCFCLPRESRDLDFRPFWHNAEGKSSNSLKLLGVGNEVHKQGGVTAGDLPS